MITITDQFMKENIAKTKQYSLVILKSGPEFGSDDAKHAIWEHGRKNFALRAEGLLPIVCSVADGTEICGVGIFTGSAEAVKKIMEADPAVAAKVLTYDIHPCRSFPGDKLP
jgi:hypothetical protein